MLRPSLLMPLATLALAVVIVPTHTDAWVVPQRSSVSGLQPGAFKRMFSCSPSALQPSSVADATMDGTTQDGQTENITLRTLYERSEPYFQGMLAVDDTHSLHYELYGRQIPEDGNDGNVDDTERHIPTALFLHGGPGAGCNPNHARFFDPTKYRIVLLDQRGCGQSTPYGEVENNTLHDLIEDLEALRSVLKMERFDIIFGGSWGTTLALAYAQRYPQTTGALLLRGICTFRQCEIDWLFAANGGIAKRNPSTWQRFQSAVNVTDEDNERYPRSVLQAYNSIFLQNGNVPNSTAQNISRSWMGFEFMASVSHTLEQDETAVATASEMQQAVLQPDDGSKQPMNFSQIMEQSKKYDSTSGPVAVCKQSPDGTDVWSLEELQTSSQEVPAAFAAASSDDISRMIHALRQNIPELEGESDSFAARSAAQQPSSPSHLAGTVTKNTTQFSAQNILTCYYSANIDHVMDAVPDILRNVDRLHSIPCVAVQGGKDRITPIDTALELKARWPALELRVPTKAGHSMYDPAITHEIVQATDRFVSK